MHNAEDIEENFMKDLKQNQNLQDLEQLMHNMTSALESCESLDKEIPFHVGTWSCTVDGNIGRPKHIRLILDERQGSYSGTTLHGIVVIQDSDEEMRDPSIKLRTFTWNSTPNTSIHGHGWWILSEDRTRMDGVYHMGNVSGLPGGRSWECVRVGKPPPLPRRPLDYGETVARSDPPTVLASSSPDPVGRSAAELSPPPQFRRPLTPPDTPIFRAVSPPVTTMTQPPRRRDNGAQRRGPRDHFDRLEPAFPPDESDPETYAGEIIDPAGPAGHPPPQYMPGMHRESREPEHSPLVNIAMHGASTREDSMSSIWQANEEWRKKETSHRVQPPPGTFPPQGPGGHPTDIYMDPAQNLRFQQQQGQYALLEEPPVMQHLMEPVHVVDPVEIYVDPKLNIGTNVTALWPHDGSYYDACIKEISLDGLKYLIAYDGFPPADACWVSRKDFAIKETLTRGARVEILYSQENKWYPGEIVSVNQNGVFTVRYDEDGFTENKPRSQIRPTENSNAPVRLKSRQPPMATRYWKCNECGWETRNVYLNNKSKEHKKLVETGKGCPVIALQVKRTQRGTKKRRRVDKDTYKQLDRPKLATGLNVVVGELCESSYRSGNRQLGTQSRGSTLRPGLKGTIINMDDGWALVSFEGMQRHQWVNARDTHKLVVENRPWFDFDDDETFLAGERVVLTRSLSARDMNTMPRKRVQLESGTQGFITPVKDEGGMLRLDNDRTFVLLRRDFPWLRRVRPEEMPEDLNDEPQEQPRSKFEDYPSEYDPVGPNRDPNFTPGFDKDAPPSSLQSDARCRENDVRLTPEVLHRAMSDELKWSTTQAFDPCPYPAADWDGLKIPWAPRTYCNPPYTQSHRWARKAIKEFKEGNEIVYIVPRWQSEREWYQIMLRAGDNGAGDNVTVTELTLPARDYMFENPNGGQMAAVGVVALHLKGREYLKNPKNVSNDQLIDKIERVRQELRVRRLGMKVAVADISQTAVLALHVTQLLKRMALFREEMAARGVPIPLPSPERSPPSSPEAPVAPDTAPDLPDLDMHPKDEPKDEPTKMSDKQADNWHELDQHDIHARDAALWEDVLPESGSPGPQTSDQSTSQAPNLDEPPELVTGSQSPLSHRPPFDHPPSPSNSSPRASQDVRQMETGYPRRRSPRHGHGSMPPLVPIRASSRSSSSSRRGRKPRRRPLRVGDRVQAKIHITARGRRGAARGREGDVKVGDRGVIRNFRNIPAGARSDWRDVSVNFDKQGMVDVRTRDIRLVLRNGSPDSGDWRRARNPRAAARRAAKAKREEAFNKTLPVVPPLKYNVKDIGGYIFVMDENMTFNVVDETPKGDAWVLATASGNPKWVNKDKEGASWIWALPDVVLSPVAPMGAGSKIKVVEEIISRGDHIFAGWRGIIRKFDMFSNTAYVRFEGFPYDIMVNDADTKIVTVSEQEYHSGGTYTSPVHDLHLHQSDADQGDPETTDETRVASDPTYNESPGRTSDGFGGGGDTKEEENISSDDSPKVSGVSESANGPTGATKRVTVPRITVIYEDWTGTEDFALGQIVIVEAQIHCSSRPRTSKKCTLINPGDEGVIVHMDDGWARIEFKSCASAARVGVRVGQWVNPLDFECLRRVQSVKQERLQH